MIHKNSLIQYAFDSQWNIGFVNQEPTSILTNGERLQISWMVHDYRDRWFADPFILDVGERYIKLLVEECRYSDHKGRIALLTVDKDNYRLVDNHLVLELPTHLSFPIYYRDGKDVYLYPESGESGTLMVYRLDLENFTVEKAGVLIDEPVSDAVIVNHNDDTFIFAITWPEPSTDLLKVYKKENDGFKCFRTITFDSKIARNAGNWFYVGNRFIRPAQDCNRRYGHALVFQEVNLDKMTFSTIKRFVPASKKYDLGIHTYNYLDGVAVVDGYGYRRPFLAHLYATISNTYHKIIGVDYRI